MKDPYQQHGAFSWFELMTTDVESAKTFYTQLFGWETEDMPMENLSYTITKIGDEGAGGIMPIPPEGDGRQREGGVGSKAT
jgi:predicted enzyme related to lactoylglutathione lyase